MLASGLAADAFAVSISKGMGYIKAEFPVCLKTGLWFGIFQTLMPVAGYLAGSLINNKTEKIGMFISFFLLFIIGEEMIRNSEKNSDNISSLSDCRSMTILAFATSLDAFTAGTAISMNKINNIFITSLFAGAITFTASSAGVRIGSIYGGRHRKTSRAAGGAVLIFIAIKILIDYLYSRQ